MLFALALMGCKPTSELPATEGVATPACVADLEFVSPADGTGEVSVNTVFEFRFTSQPGSQWSFDLPGVQGSLDMSPNGLSALFTPSEPLEFETDYTLSVEVCGVTTEHAFSTIHAPSPIYAGDTYLFPVSDLVWNQPSSSALFLPFIDFDELALQITEVSADGTTFDGLFTATWNGGQPVCSSVVDIAGDYSDAPFFVTDAPVLSVPVENGDASFEILIEDLVFTGRFVADIGVDDVSFTGLMDTRPFNALLGEGAVCDLAILAGDSCGPCGDGEPWCLAVDVEMPTAELDGPDIQGFCFPSP